MSRDKQTYGKVRGQFDEWIKLEANRPARAHLRRDLTDEDQKPGDSKMTPPHISRFVAAGIGFGITGALLLLAGYSFFTAGYYAEHARDGASTGFTLVGFFLLIAGIGGSIAVYNHNFRVLSS